MGVCGSTATGRDEKTRELDRKMQMDAELRAASVKLLLLGPGESGKSTVFKQMKLLYGVPYSEYELQHYKRIIHENIVKNTKVLLQRAREENLALNDAADAGERIEMLGDDSVLDKTHAEDISLLWKSETIQKCYNDRAELQLNDSAAYYFEKIDGICDPDYQPTNADVLHSRVRTSGIVQSTYEIDGVTFEMYDVGGQRNERKKWIHCFDGVTALIFVVGVSEYDQQLFEDNTTNRLVEAFDLFEKICNTSHLSHIPIILFLNKKDLFEEKIARKKLEEVEYFKDCTAGNDAEKALDYIDARFRTVLDNCISRENKNCYTHATCATDSKNIQVVFNSCKDIILRSNLEASGLI